MLLYLGNVSLQSPSTLQGRSWVDWLIMSTGRDYISELWLPTGLLFISQVIYEHEELWWNNIDRENSWFVHRSSLAILPAESSSNKQEERGKETMNLTLRSFFLFILPNWLFTRRKISRHGADGFTSQKEVVRRVFIALKNPSPPPGLNPPTFGPMESTLTITPPKVT
jgi:hypothetical protein